MRFGTTLLFLLAVGLISSVAHGAGPLPAKASVEFRGSGSGTVGRYDLMLPLYQDHRSMLFGNLRMVDAEGKPLEGNLGFGYRRRHSSGLDTDIVWGAYGFVDRLKSSNNNYFNQLSIGAELFTNRWSLRANGYFPDTGPRDTASAVIQQLDVQTTVAAAPPLVRLMGTSLVRIDGTTTTTTTTTSSVELTARERALRGFDAEIGRWWQLSRNNEIGIHGGYYRFSNSGAARIEGPRARAELRFFDLFDVGGSELALGMEWREDNVRTADNFFTARLRIPFALRGSRTNESSFLDRRMTEFVVRDVDIVTVAEDLNAAPGTVGGPSAELLSETTEVSVVTEHDESLATELVDPVTGERIDLFVVAADGTGDCTEHSPCTLEQAEDQSGIGDVIFLSNRNGVIAENIVLKQSQRLLGTGDDTSVSMSLPDDLMFTIDDPSGRGTLAPTVVGTRTVAGPSPECFIFGPPFDFDNCPIFSATYYDAGGPAITLANGSLVQGIAVTSGDTGVFGEDVSDISVRDIVIANASQGMEESADSPLDMGIQLRNISNAVIDSSSITDIRGTAVKITGGSQVEIRNNFIERAKATDVVVSAWVDRIFKGGGLELNDISDLTVTDNSILDTNIGSIVVKNGLGLFRIDDNTMTDERVRLDGVSRMSIARNSMASLELTNTDVALVANNVVPRFETFGGSMTLADNTTSLIRVSVASDGCLDLQGGQGLLSIGRDVGTTATLKLPGYTGGANSAEDIADYFAARHSGGLDIADPYMSLPRAPLFLGGACETP